MMRKDDEARGILNNSKSQEVKLASSEKKDGPSSPLSKKAMEFF